MKTAAEKRFVQQFLEEAGVRINGQNRHDIPVHNPAFYLRVIAGSFRARGNQLRQIVYSKNGVPGVYSAAR